MTLVRPRARSPIDFLVERRFPGYHVLKEINSIDLRGRSSISPIERRARLDAANAYRDTLAAKSAEEIAELYEREVALAQKEALALADREEQARPFNRPDATADFAHWSKAPYWSLDEALALVFGRAPEVVTWKVVEPYKSISAFAKAFARTRDLAIRAKNCKLLHDPILPGLFLAWARRTGVEIPEALIGEVETRGVVVADWKDNYDSLMTTFDGLVVENNKMVEINRQLISEHRTLAERAAKLEHEAASWQFDEADPSYPEELDIAMQAWRAVSTRRDPTLTPKQQILEWLSKHYGKLLPEQRARISMICNWEKQGGRRSSEPKG